MTAMGKLCEKRKGLEIEVVAKNLEDYLSFSIKVTTASLKRGKNGVPKCEFFRIRFIDTCQFLQNSLEDLVKNLGKDKCDAMKAHFNDNDIEMLARKQVYPYDYMSTWEKFQETRLPPITDFFNILTQSSISEEDYDHAVKVWRRFGLTNLGDYHDLYLKTDVLLLADVFENFRTFAMEMYGLDPVHYITLPSYGMDAMLRMTGACLELLTDPDMYGFFEEGIRGGISLISHRYARANNKYLDDYDPSKRSSYISYLDVNNLYGNAMTEMLPYSGFQWMAKEELDTLDVNAIGGDRLRAQG
jgi:hypothetical protein